MYFLLIYVQFTAPPEIRELETLPFLEKADEPVAAPFFSFSGRDSFSIPPSIIRQFSLEGGGSMRGITIPKSLTPNDTARSAIGPWLRLMGITPVAVSLR
jgi:hypothetical protein